MTDDINNATQAGLDFLAKQQLAQGESSPSLTNWQPRHRYKTNFVPALVLNCLANIPQATTVRHDLASQLLKQRSTSWSFNYWPRGGAEDTKFTYPDDLDDTFCTLIGLFKHERELIDEDSLAQIIHLLIAQETVPGGPYRTWLVANDKPASWQNVDLAVNANIAYFLQLIGSPSPPLLKYLEAAVLAGDYQSDFYPTSFPVWYYLARVCPLECQPKLRQDILLAKTANALQATLSLNALRQLNTPEQALNKLKNQLLKAQQPDGSWPADAYCLDPSRDGQKYYHGSAALTTALALEALQPKTSVKSAKPTNSQAEGLHQVIVRHVEADLAILAPDLQQNATKLVNKLLATDGDHKITLLPYYFGQSLRQELPRINNFYMRLGAANFYGWLAYAIYDDFIDEEGQPAQLPVANWAMRRSLDYFLQAAPNDHSFQKRVSQTFDVIDEANAWELANCRSLKRLPDYAKLNKLAERSLGHTLGPQAILSQAGFNLDGQTVWDVRQAFQHYLIARQLDDDAHDWQADYTRGQVNYVVAQILGNLKNPTLAQMQRQFWQTTLPQVCLTMQEHLSQARVDLAKANVLLPGSYLAQLIDEVEASAAKTLAKQSQAANFLKSYRGAVTK